MKNLDFIIIGTQKGGTTSLFKYLSQHPNIVMPHDKEAPFFNQENNSNTFEQFLKQNFAHAKAGQLRGKASPQYMSSPDIAARIYHQCPNIKLIAVLRDPIKRAFSHYQMAVRRGTETRSFDEAIAQGLSPEALKQGRNLSAPTHDKGYESEALFYIPWGEYGRILQPYVTIFGRGNIQIIYANELKQNPQACLNTMVAFLNLSGDFTPNNIGKNYHQGGAKAIVSIATIQKISRYTGLKWLASHLPESRRKMLRFWIDQFNSKKGAISSDLSKATREKLEALFRQDAVILDSLNIQVSW